MPLLVLSLVASAVFVVLVSAAHLLKPEIDPRWRMLSELSIGRHGWVMNAAFVAWSVSNLSLAVGLVPLVPLWALLLLGLVSLGPLGAAFAVTDPITIPPEDQTRTGRVHTGFGMLFIFGLPLVVAVFGRLVGGGFVAALALVVCDRSAGLGGADQLYRRHREAGAGRREGRPGEPHRYPQPMVFGSLCGVDSGHRACRTVAGRLTARAAARRALAG